MIHEFKLSTLLELDGGRVPEAWEQAVKRCVLDCQDRPGVTKSRKVTLNLDLTPVMGEDGDIDSIRAQFQIKDTAPVRETKKYDLGFRRGGMLVFNDMSDDNIHQTTID